MATSTLRGQNRIRFFGVNTALGANLPEHAEAEKIAPRLAKFGINCVRLHHMGHATAPRGIWNADIQTLDTKQQDKLDYCVAQLKAHGNAVHRVHKNVKVPKMGKPILPKQWDPLFRLNHTITKLRSDLDRLSRQTWSASKTASALADHMAIYIAFNNGYAIA